MRLAKPMRIASISLLLPPMMMLSACSTVSSLWQDDGSGQSAVASAPVSSGISVLWQNNVDQRIPASPPGFSLPAAVVNKQGEFVVVGSQDRRVRIYNVGGTEVARIALENACESGALKLSNGLVVVGDLGGILYGLDISSATIVWRQSLASALIGKPVAVGNDFIIQTSNNQIYRFTADGKKLWSYSGGRIGGLGMHLNPSPLVYQDRIYAVLSNADVVTLKAENGNVLWKRQLLLGASATVLSELKVPLATPLLIPAGQSGDGPDEDVLLVSVFQSELTFLSLRDGSTLRTRQLSLKSAPLLLGNRVIVADASGAVSALSVSDATTLWKQQVSDAELTGPLLWQGSLWVADTDGRVFRLNQRGKVLASTALSGRIDRTPVAAKGGVLVRNNLGTLYKLR